MLDSHLSVGRLREYFNLSRNTEWNDANFINCTYNIADGWIHIIKAQSDWNRFTENVTQLRAYLSLQKHLMRISYGVGWAGENIRNVRIKSTSSLYSFCMLFYCALKPIMYNNHKSRLIEKCVQIDNCCSNFLTESAWLLNSICFFRLFSLHLFRY